MPEQRTYRRFNLIAGGFASAGAIATLLLLFGPHHSYLFLGLVFLGFLGSVGFTAVIARRVPK